MDASLEQYLPFLALPPEHIMGWQGDVPVTNAQFQVQIGQWHALLSTTADTKFALYTEDSLTFASTLYGAWLAHKTLYLPSDALPGTCTALSTVVDGFIGTFDAQWSTLSAAHARAYAPTDLASLSLHDSAAGLVVYTSGSTGKAQAIHKNLRQLFSEVRALESLFGHLAHDSDIIATVSHQHIYGLLFKVLWPISLGRAVHMGSAVFIEELLPLLSTRACILVSSPAHLKRFPDSPAMQAHVGSTQLRAIFCSGGPLPAEAAHANATLLGRMPIEVYGSSETGGVAWRQRPGAPATDESWEAFPSVQWRVDSTSQELEVRSSHLPDDDWFHMADRVQEMGNRRFILKGRSDRIVKLEEKRISLDAIERLLMDSPLVQEARVFLHEQHNATAHIRQRIAACIVLTPAGHSYLSVHHKVALNTQLRDRLAGNIERIGLPRSWRYVDALPVNAQGKTTHAMLSALFVSDQAHAAPTMPEHQVVSRDALQVTLQLAIPPGLLYFQGHFPETPILPGVVQVDWAITYGRQYLPIAGQFSGMQALKFQRVIQPNDHVTMTLQYDHAKSALHFAFSSVAGPHASGRILFGAA